MTDGPRHTLLVVRHPPRASPPGGGAAARLDLPITVPIELAAAALVELIAKHRPTALHTSPLSRCAAPAAVAATHLGVPLVTDPRLLEHDMGAWTGQPWRTLMEREPEAYRDWLANWQTVAPPGGESADDVAVRVDAWRQNLAPGVHAVITHAGVVRALAVLVHHTPWPEAMALPIPCLTEPGALTVFRY